MAEFATKSIKLVRGMTKKRSVRVYPRDSISLDNGYWSGGSRTTYSLIRIEDGARLPLSYPTSPFSATPVPIHQIAPGTAVIVGGTFCGKEATMTVYANACDVPGIIGLPALSADTPEPIARDYLQEHGIAV